MKRILLLGGVTEALAIARTLGPQHIYSLAGVGRVPTDLTLSGPRRRLRRCRGSGAVHSR